MDPALRARLFRTDSDAWHNENYVFVGGPAFALVGGLVGFAIALPLGLPPLHEVLFLAACTGLTTTIGLVLLALIDLENDPES